MPQSLTCLHTHIIFSTKQRQCLIADNLKQRLYDYMGGIIANENGTLIAVGGAADHVHLLAKIHPQSAVSDLVRVIKSNSSKWIHDTFPAQSTFAWQAGYGAFAVSCSHLDRVKQYIGRQAEHHRTVSFKEEYLEFLSRHGVSYDERYMW